MTTPTPTTVQAAPAPSNGSSSGATPISTLVIEIIGVVILSIIAGIGPRTGKLVALFMAGLLVLWLVLNATTLAKLIPGTGVSTQG
jgi:hypothetical protein